MAQASTRVDYFEAFIAQAPCPLQSFLPACFVAAALSLAVVLSLAGMLGERLLAILLHVPSDEFARRLRRPCDRRGVITYTSDSG